MKANWYEQAVLAVPLPRGTLDAVPLKIGEWIGEDVPLDEEIVKRTDTDDHLNRKYHRIDVPATVSVFAGCGVKLRDLMPHRPTVCYIGAGWTLEGTRTAEIEMDGGAKLPCQIHTFYKSGLDSARIVVLNYYIMDGEYSSDIELLRSKARHMDVGTRYLAQVQVAAFSRGSQAYKLEEVEDFAAVSASDIRQVLERAADTVSPTSNKITATGSH